MQFLTYLSVSIKYVQSAKIIDNYLLMAFKLQNFCPQALWPEGKINIKIKPSSPQVKNNYRA
jgi:hypothetical protein